MVIDQIGERVTKSMFHLILASVLVGICTWLLLLFFGVQHSDLLGVAAGLLNCVPYLGPAVVAAGLLLAGLLQFGDIATAAMVAGASLVVTTLEGSLFTPIVFGRSVQLNPVAVFVSFLFWGWLWGIADVAGAAAADDPENDRRIDRGSRAVFRTALGLKTGSPIMTCCRPS